MLRVFTEYPHLTGRSLAMALEDLDSRRLPRAIGAKESEDLAARNPQVNASHGLKTVVRHPQARDLDHRVGHSRPDRAKDARRLERPIPGALDDRQSYEPTLATQNMSRRSYTRNHQPGKNVRVGQSQRWLVLLLPHSS